MSEYEDSISPPSHYDRVMLAARELSASHGLASFSGEESVNKFDSLAGKVKSEAGNLFFIDQSGEVTKEVRSAVAALIVEDGKLSAHLYFKERFNQPVEKE